MRGRRPVLLGEIAFGSLPEAPKRNDRIDDLTWRRAVGIQIAQRSRPVKIEGGALLLRVASSAWAQELALLKPMILRRLREVGIALSEIRFRVGPVEPMQRLPGRNVRIAKKPVKLPEGLASVIDRVKDAELREAIAAAAGANLAWQEAITSKPRGARDPRSAVAGSVRSDRAIPSAPEARRGTRGGRRG